MNYLRQLLSLFVLFAATAVWADVEINETTFPDENFRNWVLSQSYGQDSVLTEEEIAGVTKISLTSKKYYSLKGIEYFTELTFLLVELARITEIDVSKLTKLTYLDCSLTQISKLDVSKNTALTELYCASNLLNTLDISNNSALTTLSCSSNKLTSLNVTNNSALEVLFCNDNQLTELDVSKNTAIRRVWCSDNELTKLEVHNLKNLESLKCIQNRLEKIIVSDCPKLWEIDCFNNQIKGEAIDELITGLSVIPEGWGHLCIVSTEDEQNVMTKSQVAAARAKGWRPCYKYGTFGEYGYPDYEGSDDTTGIDSIHNSEFIIQNSQSSMVNGQSVFDLQGRHLSGKPARGIYIENGKKILR